MESNLDSDVEDIEETQMVESVAETDTDENARTKSGRAETADTTMEKRLYIVDFDDEAERKRVDSAIESWDGGDGGRPSGSIRVAEGKNHDELLDILTAKVPVDHIESYKMDPVDIKNPTVINILKREVQDSKESVDTILNFIITSHRGNMIDPRGSLEMGSSIDDMEDVPLYRVGNKKGTVKIAYEVTETDTGCHIRIAIKGHHIPADYVEGVVDEDLERFERSKQQQGGGV